MNKKTKLVLDLLKPKAASLGFSKEELEGAAEKIADNLGVEDDASDEVLSAAAAKAVDSTLPFLELSQKTANRIIQKNKEEREKAEAEAKKKAEEEAAAKAEEDKKKADEKKENPFESEWAKNMKAENEKLSKQLKAQQDEFKAFRDEFNAMKTKSIKDERGKRLETLLDGTGIFGERIKKNYAKMSFDTDDDFNDFFNGVQEDIKAFNQERADKGLEKLGTLASGEQTETGKVEPMSDAEVDALAAIM